MYIYVSIFIYTYICIYVHIIICIYMHIHIWKGARNLCKGAHLGVADLDPPREENRLAVRQRLVHLQSRMETPWIRNLVL